MKNLNLLLLTFLSAYILLSCRDDFATSTSQNENSIFVPESRVIQDRMGLSPSLSNKRNKDNHAIVDIAESGLIPINEFMLEENFKQRVKRYIKGNKKDYKMVEPEVYLSLFKRYVKNEFIRDNLDNPYSMRAYSVALKTRHGDFICFLD